MNEVELPQNELLGLRFAMYSAKEITKLSVKEVTNPQMFDALMHPTHGGLHDPAFGVGELFSLFISLF